MKNSHNLRDDAIRRGLSPYYHSWRLCINQLYFFQPISEEYVEPRTRSLYKVPGFVKSSVGDSVKVTCTFSSLAIKKIYCTMDQVPSQGPWACQIIKTTNNRVYGVGCNGLKIKVKQVVYQDQDTCTKYEGVICYKGMYVPIIGWEALR